MSLLLRQVFKLLYLLNSERSKRSIAVGVACGLILGFSPLTSLQSIFVVLVLLVFRVQIGAAILSMVFFKTFTPVLETSFHEIGSYVLSLDALRPVFQFFYNAPLLPYTRFYNSVVLGAGLVAVVFTIPVYFLACWLIDRYRASVLSWLKDSKYWSYWRKTTFYQWYIRYSAIFD